MSDHFSWLPPFQLPIAGYILISTGQILFSASWISILAQVPKFNPKEPTFIISDVGGACLSYVCWCTLWPHQTGYGISMYIHHQSKRSASQLNQLSPINLGLNIRNPFPFEGVSCFPHPNCHVFVGVPTIFGQIRVSYWVAEVYHDIPMLIRGFDFPFSNNKDLQKLPSATFKTNHFNLWRSNRNILDWLVVWNIWIIFHNIWG